MSRDYDHTFKQNIHEIFPALCKKHLGIDLAGSVDIKDKLNVTLERETDFLQIVTTTQGDEFIVHLEFQVADDQQMIHRMHFYWGLLRQKFKLPVKQYVIFIGRTVPTMRTVLPPDEMYKGFELLDVATWDYSKSLSSKVPEEIILAALGNVEEKDMEGVLRQIILSLQKLTTSDKAFNKYLRQLFVLARLRSFTYTIKKILREMGVIYNVKEDAFYQEGVEEGIKKGIEKGLEEGIEKGLEKGKKAMIIQLLKDGDFTIKKIAKISGMTIKQIQEIAESPAVRGE